MKNPATGIFWDDRTVVSNFILFRFPGNFNHAFLVLKEVTEMSFLVLKRVSGNSEEDQYFILPNCSLVIELQFGNI